LRLDVTDPDSVAEAVAAAGDVTILVNNAGISRHADLLTSDWDDIRAEMETNFYGSLSTIRAFAPVITANGGGAILNVLSVLSWLHMPSYGSYATSKAAGWAMTDVLRTQLEPSNIAVTGLYVAYMDTDMAHYVPAENKTDPRVVAAKAVDGVEQGVAEVLADDVTTQVKAGLSGA
jgi:short-subunit dehydrogenase